MQPEKESNKDLIYRKKRVQRLKKAIIIAILTCIMVPTVISIFLGIQVYRLHKQVDQLQETSKRQETGDKSNLSASDTIAEAMLSTMNRQTIEPANRSDSLTGAETHQENTDSEGQAGDADKNTDGDAQNGLDEQAAYDMQGNLLAKSNAPSITPAQSESKDVAGKKNSDSSKENTDKKNTKKSSETSGSKSKTEQKKDKDKGKDDAEQKDLLSEEETDASATDINAGLSNYNLLGKYNQDEIASLSTNIYKGKKVYLTFDDGPSIYTDEILDILAEYNIKATFFVIGKSDENSKRLYKRIVEEGHTLGMHSYSHVYKKIYNSVEDFDKDFTKLWKLLYDTTGYKPTIFRFPGGSDNSVNKKKKEIIKYLKKKNIIYYDWNVVNGDATGVTYTKEQLIDNVLKDVAKKKNCIVLMHDSQAKKTTVESLPELIETLIFGNAEILPLDETVPPIQMIKADSVK